MTSLAPKNAYGAPLPSGNNIDAPAIMPLSAGMTARRALGLGDANANSNPNSSTYTSPTESNFSNVSSDPESSRGWDEEQVCDWLHSVGCGAYEKLFRKNNINGENLLEMDKQVLQEMGIEKIGDRVRLFVGIKKLRTRAYAKGSKRQRDSFAALENSPLFTPGGTARPTGVARSNTTMNKRSSRMYDAYSVGQENQEPSQRPTTFLDEATAVRAQRYNGVSPREVPTREQGQGYFQGNSSQSARYPGTPADRDTPQTARLIGSHMRGQNSVDGSLMSSLPEGQEMIRVISKDGVTKVVQVAGCKTQDDVLRITLRKFHLHQENERNYCLWTLAGLEPDPANCRRLHEPELMRIIQDANRPERNRLILRKIHAGEPEDLELQRAADIAIEESQQAHAKALESTGKKSQLKAQKILGESWDMGSAEGLSPSAYSMAGSIAASERNRNINNAANALERPAGSPAPSQTRKPRRGKNDVLKSFFGARPPSELITADLTTFFPNHDKEEIDRTARLSLRRSQRLSRVGNRLSVASNVSFASSMRDAPPMPRIEDTWLAGQPKQPQLRVFDRGHSIYRDSVASSMLEPLQEEGQSPTSGESDEPNRKSYISFAGDSGEENTHVNVTDPDGNTVTSYFDDGTLTSSNEAGSLRDLNQALNEDGEGVDDDLQSFLAGDSWDDSKWMKGALIGQGSFGSVYLALHTVTGELLAVKQVEAPAPGMASAKDQKKKTMIDALKREIGLLRELSHPNIVQYLGCSNTPEHLNIFLEYVPGGSVQTMLNSYGALREPLIRSFCRQIVTGLAYLHGRDIVHRDIKGANILVDNKGGIKISDFGISKKMDGISTLKGPMNSKNRPSLQGSVFWMAPEVVKQTKYTRKSDIWSLGCLVVEMMTGLHPYPDLSQLQAIFRIGGGSVTPNIPEVASQDARVFLGRTFEVDDRLRPDAEQLLVSPFLDICT